MPVSKGYNSVTTKKKIAIRGICAYGLVKLPVWSILPAKKAQNEEDQFNSENFFGNSGRMNENQSPLSRRALPCFAEIAKPCVSTRLSIILCTQSCAIATHSTDFWQGFGTRLLFLICLRIVALNIKRGILVSTFCSPCEFTEKKSE